MPQKRNDRVAVLLALPLLLLLCPLAAGMMELSYTQHYSTGSEQQHGAAAGHSSSSNDPAAAAAAAVDITFTATTSASGTLLIGEDLQVLFETDTVKTGSTLADKHCPAQAEQRHLTLACRAARACDAVVTHVLCVVATCRKLP
jgi:hypothetical protein